MKRYFYTDSLAAAWMVKRFGALVISSAYDEVCFDGFVEVIDSISAKFYLHPDSLPLLEPQMGDVVQEEVTEGWETLTLTAKTLAYHRSFRYPKRIIQRDGKPFFWPESEDV